MKRKLRLLTCFVLAAAAAFSLTSCKKVISAVVEEAAEEVVKDAVENIDTSEVSKAVEDIAPEVSEGANNILSEVSKALEASGRDYGKETEYQEKEDIQTSFFKFRVNDSFIAYDVNDYVPEDEGYTHLCVNITLTNTTKTTIPVGVYDFVAYWGEGEDEYDFAIDEEFTQGQYPLDMQLAAGESVTGDVYFIVPDSKTQFSLEYLEVYDDDFEGNKYIVKITDPEIKNSAADYELFDDSESVQGDTDV